MLQSLLSSVKESVSGNPSSSRRGGRDDYVFPSVQRDTDGADCDQDCSDCTLKYPWNFKVEMTRQIYGSVKPFGTHVLVATGKSDWVPKVEHDRGSLMEAFKKSNITTESGRIMVSASNISPQQEQQDGHSTAEENDGSTSVLVLPAFLYVDRMTAADIPAFIERFVNRNDDGSDDAQQENPPPPSAGGRHLTSRPCTRDYIVLLCSHRTRDRRCGISAPQIKQELERQLRRHARDLLRDDDDERAGGVGIVFVSHLSGHKFAANVVVYRRESRQMIWLARVRPEHCEGIVKYTILEGKVVCPEERLRGGVDWNREIMSW